MTWIPNLFFFEENSLNKYNLLWLLFYYIYITPMKNNSEKMMNFFFGNSD